MTEQVKCCPLDNHDAWAWFAVYEPKIGNLGQVFHLLIRSANATKHDRYPSGTALSLRCNVYEMPHLGGTLSLEMETSVTDQSQLTMWTVCSLWHSESFPRPPCNVEGYWGCRTQPEHTSHTIEDYQKWNILTYKGLFCWQKSVMSRQVGILWIWQYCSCRSDLKLAQSAADLPVSGPKTEVCAELAQLKCARSTEYLWSMFSQVRTIKTYFELHFLNVRAQFWIAHTFTSKVRAQFWVVCMLNS